MAKLVREQADAEIVQLVAEGREAAERVRKAAEEEARRVREAAQREGEAGGRRRAAQILALADAESRLVVLRAREEAIDEALGRAQAVLGGPEGIAVAAEHLPDLVREALASIAEGAVIIRMSAAYQGLLDAADVAGVVDADRRAIRVDWSAVEGGGVIVESSDGRLRYDNSFTARMGRLRAMLRREVARELLAEEPLPAGSTSDGAPAGPGR